MKTFDEDPEKCQCHGWAFSHKRAQLWPMVQLGDSTMSALGHHPDCMYWIEPPHPSLTGADLMSRDTMAEALVALTMAYFKLRWRDEPPKPPEEEP